ncbi:MULTISPECIES: SMI1/KNR4 family protein [unclassified Paenibacillus]|uniref:SMI1/KNR4 family protein n=1 Tax=unclassified Paenibacillus TaxID=185978 RepID=UPI0030ECBA62
MDIDENIIKSSYPPVSLQEIEIVEKKYNMIFPDDYKKFLMVKNGGKTGTRRRFTTNDDQKEGEIESSILMFFPLSNNLNNNSEQKYRLYTEANILSRIYYPIGETPRNNLVCIVVEGPNKGSVYHFDMDYDNYIEKKLPLEEEHIRLITESFTDLLDSLFVSQT